VAAYYRLPSTSSCVQGQWLRIRPNKGAVSALSAVRVLLDGKRVKTLRGRSLASGVNLRLPSGSTWTVRITAITRTGRRISATYRYHRCASTTVKRPGQPPTLLPAVPGG
jgi:hypothetical protein